MSSYLIFEHLQPLSHNNLQYTLEESYILEHNMYRVSEPIPDGDEFWKDTTYSQIIQGIVPQTKWGI